jgi:hypothetical protein
MRRVHRGRPVRSLPTSGLTRTTSISLRSGRALSRGPGRTCVVDAALRATVTDRTTRTENSTGRLQ